MPIDKIGASDTVEVLIERASVLNMDWIIAVSLLLIFLATIFYLLIWRKKNEKRYVSGGDIDSNDGESFVIEFE